MKTLNLSKNNTQQLRAKYECSKRFGIVQNGIVYAERQNQVFFFHQAPDSHLTQIHTALRQLTDSRKYQTAFIVNSTELAIDF